MATHSSTLAWKIPWTEEPGRLQSKGLQSWTRLSNFIHTHTHTKQKNKTKKKNQRTVERLGKEKLHLSYSLQGPQKS